MNTIFLGVTTTITTTTFVGLTSSLNGTHQSLGGRLLHEYLWHFMNMNYYIVLSTISIWFKVNLFSLVLKIEESSNYKPHNLYLPFLG